MADRLVMILEDKLGNLYSAYQANMGEIPVETVESQLVFDCNTKVIYYNFDSFNDKKGYMAPYISENGKFCRFIDNKIVEIA